MARRPHSRAFPRSVTAPRCVAVDTARAPVAASSIVACGLIERIRERPRSFRKGVVDVILPSEGRVSKKKHKQRLRRLKHQESGTGVSRNGAHNRTDVRALCAYGTFVDGAPSAMAYDACKKDVQPMKETATTETDQVNKVPTTCPASRSASCVPTLLTELSLEDEHEDDDYDILCVDEVTMSVAPHRNHWFTSAINLFK